MKTPLIPTITTLTIFSMALAAAPAFAHHGEPGVHVEQGAKKRAAQKKKIAKPVVEKSAPSPKKKAAELREPPLDAKNRP
jgi:hypothetical protein